MVSLKKLLSDFEWYINPPKKRKSKKKETFVTLRERIRTKGEVRSKDRVRRNFFLVKKEFI